MKIPKTVRIGGVDYDVNYNSAIRSGQLACYGQIDYENAEISINPDFGKNHQHRCVTLLHEILHGIIYHAGLTLEQGTEEQIVDIISKGLYQVLQDNGRKLFDLQDPMDKVTQNTEAENETETG